VVKVQVFCAATFDAFSLIPSPYLDLYRGGNYPREWPRDFAQNGWKSSAFGTDDVIPGYAGTCIMSVQPIDEFQKLLRDPVLGGSMVTAIGLLKKFSKANAIR